MKYPVRAKIVDVTGGTFHGIPMRTPPTSMSHIGEQGLAEEVDGCVRIRLDKGGFLWGYECWWIPLDKAGNEL